MSKPTVDIRWATTSSNITEPTSGKKDEGWLPGEKAPANFFNWLSNGAYQWKEYLKNLELVESLTWVASQFFQGGISVSQSNANSDGIETAGNGSGNGISASGGTSGHGVQGTAGSSAAFGVYGRAAVGAASGTAIYGDGATVSGDGTGVEGVGEGDGYGVYGHGPNGGFFEGTNIGLLVVSPSGSDAVAIIANGDGTGTAISCSGEDAPALITARQAGGPCIRITSGALEIQGTQPTSSADNGANTFYSTHITKASGKLTTDGAGNVSVSDGVGVASVSLSGSPGEITVTLSHAMANSNYAITTSLMVNAAGTTPPHTLTTTTFKISQFNAAGTQQDLSAVSTTIAFTVNGRH